MPDQMGDSESACESVVPVNDIHRGLESTGITAALAGVGVIIPPDDIKSIIDKTAGFVAKNGAEFESKILQSKKDQFSFLLTTSPYRAYFDKKLKEIIEGVEEKPVIPKAIGVIKEQQVQKDDTKRKVLALTEFGDPKNLERPQRSIFISKHPYIASVDLDIIKTTSQFVARNGQPFLVGLSQRERSNPQFDFLKPTHSLFHYFTTLVDCYSQIFKPTPDMLNNLKKNAFGCLSNEKVCLSEDPFESNNIYTNIYTNNNENSCLIVKTHPTDAINTLLDKRIDLDELWTRPNRSAKHILESETKLKDIKPAMGIIRTRVYKRYLWETHQRAKKAEVERKANAEREANLSIDWTTFQIVSTIEFDPTLNYDLPVDFSLPVAPAAPLALGLPSLRESTAATFVAESPKLDLITVSRDDGPIKIVKDYQRGVKRSFGDTTIGGRVMQKCPITGRLVEANQMSEHLRVLLLDSKWRNEKEILLKKAQAESAFAPVGDIESNLAQFVSGRPDIFGTVDDQVAVQVHHQDEASYSSDPKKARLWLQG